MKNVLITIACICLLPIAYSSEGTDLWFTVNSSSKNVGDNTKTKTHFEIRLPDFEEIGYFRVSQKFNTNIGQNWSLGTHPVVEFSKQGDDWNNTYRFDLELNPAKFTLGENGPSISMRNRWELRWKEGKGSEIFHRVRHSSKATWKIDTGPFTSFTIGDEIFYEADKGKITKNRFYPVMLGSKLGAHNINYYLLYDSSRQGTSDNWNGRYIVGSSLSF
ncbi:DUF2490 domain-containing protein [Pelagicoccus sp. SDUM812002]|uniref:DUF2490 domain-containing protein n=1 Tax=Pelagicoccus sp. SDUM812002 TaxID=3041266 RepID=UPI00280E248C|nr:DUF2490 domain-containing protein [Pelagicoccus sp. SDUM812002]MDQ8185462.1 DUF2490 domain-containing protein [Pelagicoccus sp. SDUM812002]